MSFKLSLSPDARFSRRGDHRELRQYVTAKPSIWARVWAFLTAPAW
jgi:hypothetical protein